MTWWESKIHYIPWLILKSDKIAEVVVVATGREKLCSLHHWDFYCIVEYDVSFDRFRSSECHVRRSYYTLFVEELRPWFCVTIMQNKTITIWHLLFFLFLSFFRVLRCNNLTGVFSCVCVLRDLGSDSARCHGWYNGCWEEQVRTRWEQRYCTDAFFFCGVLLLLLLFFFFFFFFFFSFFFFFLVSFFLIFFFFFFFQLHCLLQKHPPCLIVVLITILIIILTLILT